MSLVVSLRIPDGVVIAADSISTTQARVAAQEVATTCPKCKNELKIPLDSEAIPVTSSTFSFAQKVFPYGRRFGIGTYGLGILNMRTTYHHVRALEGAEQGVDFEGVTEAAEHLAQYFHGELKKQAGDALDSFPEDAHVLGLHLVGYDGSEAKTKVVNIGKEAVVEEYTGIGCSVGGDTVLAQHLWALGREDQRQHALYPNFSLQDAIDYAKFLIKTTADYQRFGDMIPTVGGNVDIGLITPYQEFTWIESKTLTRVLEERRYPEDA